MKFPSVNAYFQGLLLLVSGCVYYCTGIWGNHRLQGNVDCEMLNNIGEFAPDL